MSRERDPVRLVPRLPQHPGTQSRQRKENNVNLKTNRTLESVRQMEAGRLDSASLLEPAFSRGELNPEENEFREKAMEIRGWHKARSEEEAAKVTGAEALERLLKEPVAQVSWEESSGTSTGTAELPPRLRPAPKGREPCRGEVC